MVENGLLNGMMGKKKNNMKKLLGILVLSLLLSGNGYAEIYELNRCVVMQENQAKYTNAKWTKDFYEKQNNIYYLYLDQPEKMVGGGFNIVAEVTGEYLDDKDVNEYLAEGWKKIKWRERYSYTIDTDRNIVIELNVKTDEYLDFQREKIYRTTELYKEKGIYNKYKKSLDRSWKLFSKKREIKEYKIEQIVGNLLIAHRTDQYKYYPEERFAIMINLDDLTVAFDQVKYLNNQNRSFFRLCGSDFESDGGTDSNGGGSSGTAFFISNRGHLLTNNHVVEGCSISKITYKNNDYDTKLIATDKTLDLALLKAELRPKSFFNFSKNEVKKLNKVYVAGYPLGKGLSDDLKISSGIVSSLKGYKDNSNEIQIDAPINPGNSGGPIINENGDLIAIAVSGLAKDQTEGINFGIKSSAAELFLRSNKVTPKKAMYSGIKDNDKLLEILEQGTVYTYCD